MADPFSWAAIGTAAAGAGTAAAGAGTAAGLTGLAAGATGTAVFGGAAGMSSFMAGGSFLAGGAGATAIGGGSLIAGGLSSVTAGSLFGGSALAGGASTFLGMTSPQWAGVGLMGNLMSGASQMQSGDAMKQQYAIQARNEETAAKYREVQRKERLLQSLASQNAARAAQGIRAYEGSPAAMMQSDMNAYFLERYADTGATSMRVRQYGRSGKAAQNTALFSAGSSLLEYGAKAALTQV